MSVPATIHEELNEHMVATATPPEAGQRFIRDTTTRGLAVRITAGGARSYTLESWINGRSRRMTLGRCDQLSLAMARKRAKEYIGQFASGIDVVAAKRAETARNVTLATVFAEYVQARKNLKASTVKDMQRAIRETFEDWLSKPVIKITEATVLRRHQERGAKSPARANLAFRYLRAWLTFASSRYKDDEGRPLMASNPVKALSEQHAWYRVQRRQTVIKPHELGGWVRAVRTLKNATIGDFYMVTVLTGLRREEALGLRWQDVDLTAGTLVIRDPKNRRDHTIPLSDFLWKLLEARHTTRVGAYVFADSKGRRLGNLRFAQAAIAKECGVSVTPHDLRRTFATVAESLDIPAYALKRLLNHADGADVTAGYVVPSPDRLRAPLQKITDFVLDAAEIGSQIGTP